MIKSAFSTSFASALITAILFAAPILQAETHQFTDSNGNTIQAEIVSVSGESVTIKRNDGRSFTTKTSVFSEEDRKFIAAWQKAEALNRIPRLEIRINNGKNDRLAKDGDYDNRTAALQFKVSIENEERNFDIVDAKATLLIFGKSVFDSGRLKVMSRESFDLSVPEGATAVLNGEEVVFKYDDNDSAKFGHKYGGYLVVIQNEGGKIIGHKCVPEPMGKYLEAALKLKSGQSCDRYMTPKKEL